MLASQFLTHTLRAHPHGQTVAAILASAINAVEPGQAVRRYLRREANTVWVEKRPYALNAIERIFILGLGKAAYAMAAPVAEMLADRAPRGLLITKHIPPRALPGFDLVLGGHPVPDEHSLAAGEAILKFTADVTPRDLLICLISGGGSALAMAPHAGVALTDMRALTKELLACGARVDEINTLRRHLDQIKGGGLARRVAPTPVVSLILSDVVGNALEAIASGPTAPDPTARADALAVLQRYALEPRLPASLLEVLRRAPETPKPGEAIFDTVHNVVVGSNELGAQAARREAEARGLHALLGRTDWQGEARAVAIALCRDFKAGLTVPRPFVSIAGGETTVTVRGPGRGGRNQEMALAAVRELADVSGVMWVSLATDGDDGPTDAAGAVVTGETPRRAETLGLAPEDYLNRNDAYSFFEALGDLLKPGPTGTNVNDLMFLFAF